MSRATSTSSLRTPPSSHRPSVSSVVSTDSSARRHDRHTALAEYWARPTPYELDVVDRGDHLKVTSCSPDVASWWMGTLRATYPQDHYSGAGSTLKMHPAMGVTLTLNKNDGTLKIKGKKHLQWFKENFEHVLESGGKGFAAIAEIGKVIDKYLKLDDGFMIGEILEHLPPSGAIKHGPTYIYRLWKGLLDFWIGNDSDVYVITPLVDAKRVADLFLLLVKHRLSKSHVTLLTMERSESEDRFTKVYKHAKEMVRDLKAPNKKRLIVEERLKMASERLSVKFGGFHCRLVAAVRGDTTEVLLSSANFHNWHFYYDHSDLVIYMRMPSEDFRCNYLEPLGLAEMDGSGDATPTGQRTPTPHNSPSSETS